jgi:hypothetical protein
MDVSEGGNDFVDAKSDAAAVAPLAVLTRRLYSRLPKGERE